MISPSGVRSGPREVVIPAHFVARPGTVVPGPIGPMGGSDLRRRRRVVATLADRQANAKAAGGAGGLLHAVVSLAGSLGNPTLASLDDESAARERHECQDEAERLGLEDRLHHQRSQRIPAPVARAIVASSMTAQVKRARFAFTIRFPF